MILFTNKMIHSQQRSIKYSSHFLRNKYDLYEKDPKDLPSPVKTQGFLVTSGSCNSEGGGKHLAVGRWGGMPRSERGLGDQCAAGRNQSSPGKVFLTREGWSPQCEEQRV